MQLKVHNLADKLERSVALGGGALWLASEPGWEPGIAVSVASAVALGSIADRLWSPGKGGKSHLKHTTRRVVARLLAQEVPWGPTEQEQAIGDILRLLPDALPGPTHIVRFARGSRNAGRIIVDETLARLVTVDDRFARDGSAHRVIAFHVVGFLLEECGNDPAFIAASAPGAIHDILDQIEGIMTAVTRIEHGISDLGFTVTALVERTAETHSLSPFLVRMLLEATGVPLTGPLADLGEIERALRRHVAEYHALKLRLEEFEARLSSHDASEDRRDFDLKVIRAAVEAGDLDLARARIAILRDTLQKSGANRAAEVTEGDRIDAELTGALASVTRLEGRWEEAARLFEAAAQTTDLVATQIAFRLESVATLIDVADDGTASDYMEVAAERLQRAINAAALAGEDQLLGYGLYLRARLHRLDMRDGGPVASLGAIADLRRAEVLARSPLMLRRVALLLGDQIMRVYEDNPALADPAESERVLRAVIDDPHTPPLDLANALNTLGALWFARARQAIRSEAVEGVRDLLAAAAIKFEQTMSIWTAREYPLDWSRARTNLAVVHRNLAAFVDTDINLERAMAGWRAVLEVRHEHERPLLWAETMSNMGVTLKAIGERENGIASLEAALDAYRRARSKRTAAKYRQSFARTQENIAKVGKIILERTMNDADDVWTARYRDAINAIFEARPIFQDLNMMENVKSAEKTIEELTALKASRQTRLTTMPEKSCHE